MPVNGYVFLEHGLLVSQFEGMITDQLFLEYYQQLLSLGGDSLEFKELIDFRKVDKIEISKNALNQISNKVAEAYETTESRLKCAVLASSDLIYGMSRMYEMGYSPDFVEIMVFRDLLEALTWLEVQELNFAKRLNILSKDNCSEFLFLSV